MGICIELFICSNSNSLRCIFMTLSFLFVGDYNRFSILIIELNNCISKLNSAMKDLESAIDKGTISFLMNRKEMGETQLRNRKT